MVRLRIALGVASSLVAVAALTIVFAGSGEAQGNGNGPNVFVTNTPLPVTGLVNATIPGNVTVTGNVNAAVTGTVTVGNPSNNPVLIRDVDATGAKELWQEQSSFVIDVGSQAATFDFPVAAPAGKALVIEHMHLVFSSFDPAVTAPSQLQVSTPPFGVSGFIATQDFVPQRVGNGDQSRRPRSNKVLRGSRRICSSLCTTRLRQRFTFHASVRIRLTGYPRQLSVAGRTALAAAEPVPQPARVGRARDVSIC